MTTPGEPGPSGAQPSGSPGSSSEVTNAINDGVPPALGTKATGEARGSVRALAVTAAVSAAEAKERSTAGVSEWTLWLTVADTSSYPQGPRIGDALAVASEDR